MQSETDELESAAPRFMGRKQVEGGFQPERKVSAESNVVPRLRPSLLVTGRPGMRGPAFGLLDKGQMARKGPTGMGGVSVSIRMYVVPTTWQVAQDWDTWVNHADVALALRAATGNIEPLPDGSCDLSGVAS